MLANLYGNPHSGSASSQASTTRIEDTRLRVLQFFNADPVDFDVIFVANATAGIKLVMDAFRSCENGFVYGYHKDSHTSLVGVRETAVASRCFNDQDVETLISQSLPIIQGRSSNSSTCIQRNYNTELFAYPAQSNMDGRRLPLSWSSQIRGVESSRKPERYVLLDAAALVSTSQLDLSDADNAPDFTVLSFYKIFGFPDLGALLVRRESGKILQGRKYFGGGTVETVVCINEQWHMPKEQSLHESLEDGTLPIHNIIALDSAMAVHKELYESMDRISEHTMCLAQKLYSSLKALKHANKRNVCKLYANDESFGNRHVQGPIVAFNLINSHGAWISNTEVEKLATVRKIHIRTGGLCNPGGIATALDLAPWEIKRNFSAGFRCGSDNDVIAGKPTGIIRASVGAMSTLRDIERFIEFIDEFYVEKTVSEITEVRPAIQAPRDLYVKSLTIYPIKSCGGFPISSGVDWEVKPEGLAWDREWCLIHQGTGQALSQKRHPRMALIRPAIDFNIGVLLVKYQGRQISVLLSADPACYEPVHGSRSLSSRVCGDVITAHKYSSKAINDFFSEILDVPCALARFPAGGSGLNTRHSKAHMQKHQRPRRQDSDSRIAPGAFPISSTPPDSDNENSPRSILLSNESPILMINRSSLEALNGEIRKHGGKPASSSVFRANILISSSGPVQQHEPYAEDHWSSIRIGHQQFTMLGSCRRCHMICVDQDTAVKDDEPLVTLAKTRRFDGKVFFGSHMCHHVVEGAPTPDRQFPTIRVGDTVSVNTDI